MRLRGIFEHVPEKQTFWYTHTPFSMVPENEIEHIEISINRAFHINGVTCAGEYVNDSVPYEKVTLSGQECCMTYIEALFWNYKVIIKTMNFYNSIGVDTTEISNSEELHRLATSPEIHEFMELFPDAVVEAFL